MLHLRTGKILAYAPKIRKTNFAYPVNVIIFAVLFEAKSKKNEKRYSSGIQGSHLS